MAFLPKSHQPQYAFFAASMPLPIPGTNWTLTGHSRALERTGFWIPEARIVLDAGVDLPTNAGARPIAILVTHGHIDHCGALPMLLRHCGDESDGLPAVQILAPSKIVHRLRSYAQLSWSVKVDIDADLPQQYAGPDETDRDPEAGLLINGDLPYRQWLPCGPGTIANIGAVGAESSSRRRRKQPDPLVVRAIHMFHGRCSTVGYVLYSAARSVQRTRRDLVGSTKQETASNVKAARERGEEIREVVEEPEKPLLAFVLDTKIDALNVEKSNTAALALSCSVVIIECTYLEDSMLEEAHKRNHISWGELVPYVSESVKRRKEGGWHQTWILVHFSLRYTDENIIDFFRDEGQCQFNLDKNEEAASSQEKDGGGKLKKGQDTMPPDVVLWLDSGPKKLWFE